MTTYLYGQDELISRFSNHAFVSYRCYNEHISFFFFSVPQNCPKNIYLYFLLRYITCKKFRTFSFIRTNFWKTSKDDSFVAPSRFYEHSDEEITQIVSSCYMSSSVSTKIRSIKPGIKETKSFGATVLQNFILYCKYFGRLKISDGSIFRPFFFFAFIQSV